MKIQVKVQNANAILQSGSKNIEANTIQLKASAGTDPITEHNMHKAPPFLQAQQLWYPQ